MSANPGCHTLVNQQPRGTKRLATANDRKAQGNYVILQKALEIHQTICRDPETAGLTAGAVPETVVHGRALRYAVVQPLAENGR